MLRDTAAGACFLCADPGRDAEDVEVGDDAKGFGCEEMGDEPVPLFRVALFPIPLFCPDRVLRGFVPFIVMSGRKPRLERRLEFDEQRRAGVVKSKDKISSQDNGLCV